MLFSSFIFIFIFLPITLFGFFKIGKLGHHRVAIAWLVGASLFFYGWWNPAYLGLMLGSIFVNFSFGVALSRQDLKISKKIIMAIGVCLNLVALGYFKYANFFVNEINGFLGTDFHLNKIILPLAISFFTFQQIAYLVDSYKGETREYNFLHYCLFVSFFPQLIAGPIVHHKEMLPQFGVNKIYKVAYSNLAIGLTIFIIGLFKKIVIADTVAQYSTPFFAAVAEGTALSFVESWMAALAYTFQLYFDFSGYSDMAIGIARMFGILLPLNFNSPYKSKSIIEFWRRWHITLSRFLRDYLYIPLGGNRKGEVRRYMNLMITMVLGGLWHGAGWTFLIWGALHGVFLVVNNLWRVVKKAGFLKKINNLNFFGFLAKLLTFICVVCAWVYFRAENHVDATNILKSMAGMNGVSLPLRIEENFKYLEYTQLIIKFKFDGMFPNKIIRNEWFAMGWIFVLFMISWFAPNTQQIMAKYKPALETYKDEIQKINIKFLLWRPNVAYIVVVIIMCYLSISNIFKGSEFLYFDF